MKKKRNGSQIPSNSKQPTKHKSELDHPLDATYPVAVYPHYVTHTQFLCPHKPNLLSLRSSLLCVSYPNNQSSIKKNIKTIFIFFSFQKTKRRRIRRTEQLSQQEEDEDHGVTGFEVQPGRIGSGCVSDRHGRQPFRLLSTIQR